jgi:hypothetical protein
MGFNLGNFLGGAAKAAGDAVNTVERIPGASDAIQNIAGQVHIDPAIVQTIAAAGTKIANASPVISAAGNLAKDVPGYDHGFALGVGTMQTPIDRVDHLAALRGSLSPGAQQGFDTALALHVGAVKKPAPPLPPAQRAAYHIAHGLVGAPVAQKVAVMGAVAECPDCRPGAAVAIKEIASDRESLWEKTMSALGLRGPPQAPAVSIGQDEDGGGDDDAGDGGGDDGGGDDGGGGGGGGGGDPPQTPHHPHHHRKGGHGAHRGGSARPGAPARHHGESSFEDQYLLSDFRPVGQPTSNFGGHHHKKKKKGGMHGDGADSSSPTLDLSGLSAHPGDATHHGDFFGLLHWWRERQESKRHERYLHGLSGRARTFGAQAYMHGCSVGAEVVSTGRAPHVGGEMLTDPQGHVSLYGAQHNPVDFDMYADPDYVTNSMVDITPMIEEALGASEDDHALSVATKGIAP